MDKTEAAKALGRSVRVLQRYAAEGRLTVVYEQTKNGRKAVFDPEEISRLKEELENPAFIRRLSAGLPPLEEHSAPMTNAATMTTPPSQVIGEAISEAIASAVAQGIGEGIDRLAAVFREAQNGKPAVLSELAAKLTLTLPEAAALSGLPENFLSAAIKKKKLKAIKVEGAIKIKRAALEKFIAKL